MIKNLEVFVEAVNNFLNARISKEEFQKVRKKFGIWAVRDCDENFLTVRISSYLGELYYRDLYELYKSTVLICPYVKFFHITTRKNIEIQRINISHIVKLVQDLYSKGIWGHLPNSVSMVSISPLDGIEPSSVFSTEFFARWVIDYLDSKKIKFHSKFKISFSDSENDLGLVSVSDLGFISLAGLKKGFKVYFGGSLGEFPNKSILLFDFVSLKDFTRFFNSSIEVFLSLGCMRARDILILKGYERIKKLITERFQQSENIPLVCGIDKRMSDENDNIVFTKEVFNSGEFRFSLHDQKQRDFCFIEMSFDSGNIDVSLIPVLSFISKKFGKGKIRIHNRQGLIIPWIERSKSLEVVNILESVGIHRTNMYKNIVTCTGLFSCNIAILDTFKMRNKLRDIIRDTKLDINISGCPNSSGHHHLGNIGIFTVTDKGRVYNVLTIGSYKPYFSIAIGRPLIKLETKFVPWVVKFIDEAFNSSSFGTFEKFVCSVGIRNIKERIFSFLEKLFNSDIEDFDCFYTKQPREINLIDKIFCDITDLQFYIFIHNDNLDSSYLDEKLNDIFEILGKFHLIFDLDKKDIYTNLFNLENFLENKIDNMKAMLLEIQIFSNCKS